MCYERLFTTLKYYERIFAFMFTQQYHHLLKPMTVFCIEGLAVSDVSTAQDPEIYTVVCVSSVAAHDVRRGAS